MLNDLLCGFKVIENPYMVVDGEPYRVRRTWKDRLFTRPWRPLESTKMVTPKVPSDEILVLKQHQTLVMHPEIAAKLKAQADA